MTSPSDIDGAPAGPYEGSKPGASLHFSASRGGISMQATDRLVPWLLLAVAALAMALRAPIYLLEPNFWAEEGALFFAVAWAAPVQVGLTYRSTEYLQWWSNLATTTAATLVHAGLVPLARAPLVTVLFALAPNRSP